jgi:hypothetical protein
VARDHGAARQYHLYDRIRATKTAELPDVLEDEFAPLADLAELIQHGGALRGIGGRAFRRSTDIFLISASSGRHHGGRDRRGVGRPRHRADQPCCQPWYS